MCGRYSLAGPNPSQLRERFPIGEAVEVRRRYNVAPGDDVLTVTTDKQGAPRGEELRWGLVPHWAKDPKVGYKMINARSETVAEKPAFRDALQTRRCLVLADGFFEWERRPDGTKQPYRVTRADGHPYAFAGLWATWRPHPDADPLRTCSILTTRANGAMAHVHDRMPVILPDMAAEDGWLDHGTPAPLLQELLAPLPEELVRLTAVNPVVGDARHDEPDCLEPVDPTPQAPTLF